MIIHEGDASMPRVKGTAGRRGAGTIFRDTIARKPPQCRVMTCTRNYLSSKCCYFCRHKYSCSFPCLNHPCDCGMLVIPTQQKRGDKDERKDQ